MYIPQHFREERLDVLHDLIEESSFGTLVSTTPDGLFATHIPMLVDRTRGSLGTLRGHVARANPHWQHLGGSEVLAIFMGPHAYVSPSWYATTGRVPTWNYVTVHAYGTPRLTEDPSATRALIETTVGRYESGLVPPWNMSGLEPKAVDGLLGSIVAFEIPIARLEGKRKLNQNRSRADREGAVRGLRAHGRDDASVIADLMQADMGDLAKR
jgi:transcriptional regulator